MFAQELDSPAVFSTAQKGAKPHENSVMWKGKSATEDALRSSRMLLDSSCISVLLTEDCKGW